MAPLLTIKCLQPELEPFYALEPFLLDFRVCVRSFWGRDPCSWPSCPFVQGAPRPSRCSPSSPRAPAYPAAPRSHHLGACCLAALRPPVFPSPKEDAPQGRCGTFSREGPGYGGDGRTLDGGLTFAGGQVWVSVVHATKTVVLQVCHTEKHRVFSSSRGARWFRSLVSACFRANGTLVGFSVHSDVEGGDRIHPEKARKSG